MRTKTSITMAEDLLKEVDRRALASKRNRSDFLEMAVSEYLRQLERSEKDAQDVEIIENRHEHLNREAADCLEYQHPL